ncbi:MAG: response regulator [Endomicrobium sp.]|nr:response regulator [Endomicrobium sp.]
MFDKIFSNSPDIIWYVDADGKYLSVNPRFASIHARRPSDFIGKKAQDIIPPLSQEFIEKSSENIANALSSKVPLYLEEIIHFPDGHVEILDSVLTQIYDASGVLMGILGFSRNVTKRVETENKLIAAQFDLEKAVKEANRANKYKSEFLARMSHEIRTPMNAIIGLANIANDELNFIDGCGQHNERLITVKNHIGQIEVSSKHLLGLLNDILDISKIEAGKIELSKEAFDIKKLIKTADTIIRPRCVEKEIIFTVHSDAFSPSVFLSDPLRLNQVIINLLGNAVKFTNEFGAIDFYIEKKEQKAGKTLIEFRIKDTGIGIPQESLSSIFNPFEQAALTTTQKYGGTGLGLSISKHIVQLFGGNISVKSKIGQGSEFSFAIWLEEAKEDIVSEIDAAAAEGKFKNKRALIVDDIAINRMIVVSLLQNTGISTQEAQDGLDAVNKFKESPENFYDIIFMDIQMPNMNGYEAASAIRALDRPDAKNVIIIALTANAFKEDIDKAVNSGMNGHISKPVEADKLIETLIKRVKPDGKDGGNGG